MQTIIIELCGGLIAEVTSDRNVEYIVKDYDTEGMNESDLSQDEQGTDCFAHRETATVVSTERLEATRAHLIREIERERPPRPDEILGYLEGIAGRKSGRERVILDKVIEVVRRA